MGHFVTVVATDLFGRLPDDDALGIVRTGDLRSSRQLRRILGRGAVYASGNAGVEKPPPAVLTKVLVPEAQVLSWLPHAYTAVRRLHARQRYDCLVTSSPPESTHLLGLLLGARRPAWVADFRDGWVFEPLREPFPTRPQRSLDRSLERRVARAAEVVVGATKPIADDLGCRLGAAAAYVPNGWDPADEPNLEPLPVGEPTRLVTLVYTGLFAGARRDIKPLLQALKLVLDDPASPRLRLIHAGSVTPQERELVHQTGVSEAVEHLGLIPRTDALRLQRSADALLLLTSGNRSEATGKLFEYLGAGKPILALAEGNEAERIVRETRTGETVAPHDVPAIAAALRRVASGELAAQYAPRDIERFLYPRPAEAMADLIEMAIERHAHAPDEPERR